MNRLAILLVRVIAVRNIYDIIINIFLNHIPRASTQTEAFALTDCMKPKAMMFTEFSSGLNFNYGSGLFTKMTANEIIVVYFAQKTYTLRILTLCVR